MTNVLNPASLDRVVDLTQAIVQIPNVWDIYEKLGIFTKRFLTQKTALVPKYTEITEVLTDVNWGGRATNSKKGTRSYVTFQIPRFANDDSITADDLEGLVEWYSIFQATNLETTQSVRLRKMEQARRTLAQTQELARGQLINNGTVYAPNGTISTSYGSTVNFYTELGVSQTTVNVSLATLTADPKISFEPIIRAIQDNLQAGVIASGIVCICSPTFFNQLISHPYVKQSFLYWEQTQSAAVLSGRLEANVFGLDERYRTFRYNNITFIEELAAFPQIASGEGRAFPTNIPNMFGTYYAPARRLKTVNTPAQELYWFEFLNEKDDYIEIEYETNFANVLLYPQAIVRVTAV